jgi:hypothetical protein
MLKEEWPLVLATIRAYPGAQLRVSLANFTTELTNFGLWDFTANPWMQSELNKVLPGALPRYLQTRQAQSRLPNIFFTTVQQWVVVASALAIVICVPMLWRWRRWRMLGLVAILVPAVVANAFLTAVLSEVDSRYQARVIWLIPLLAGLIMLDLLDRRLTTVLPNEPPAHGAGKLRAVLPLVGTESNLRPSGAPTRSSI